MPARSLVMESSMEFSNATRSSLICSTVKVETMPRSLPSRICSTTVLMFWVVWTVLPLQNCSTAVSTASC